jgi:hypothetical protein
VSGKVFALRANLSGYDWGNRYGQISAFDYSNIRIIKPLKRCSLNRIRVLGSQKRIDIKADSSSNLTGHVFLPQSLVGKSRVAILVNRWGLHSKRSLLLSRDSYLQRFLFLNNRLNPTG